MNFKMRENSLFAVLLRSPFWISFAVAAALTLVAAMLLPREQMHLAVFAGGPFLIIGGIAAVKQLRGVSPARAAAVLEAINSLSWPAFSGAVESAFRAQGYEVRRRDGAADFEVEKAGRRQLVSCKRWKAAKHGVEPLRELAQLADKTEARAVYFANGDITSNARQFASQNNIDLMQGQRLAEFLARSLPA